MRIALIIVALVWAPVYATEVYKWTDPDGNVIYSDEPHPDAEIIDELEPQTYKAPKYPRGVLTPKPKAADAFSYETVRIAAPANDTTIRDNTGQVSVAVFLSPPLQTALGHKLVLLLDGQAQGDAGARTRFQLTNVDRGTHSLSARVVDIDGKVITTSAGATFHLHRTFVRRGGG